MILLHHGPAAVPHCLLYSLKRPHPLLL